MGNAASVMGTSDSPTDQKKKGVLGLVFFTVFLDLVGFGILIPIQPFYAELMGAKPNLITLLGASFSLMQFLFAPVWGRISDRIGRRPVMLISIASTAVGYLLFGLATTLPMLFFARMLAGIGSANIGTAQAIIADSTTREERTKGMGLIGAAFGLGFIFGPAISGFLVRFGLNVPIFFAAGLCTLNLILASIILPETLKPGVPRAEAEARGFSWRAIKHAARHANVPQLFALYLFFTMAFSMMEQVLSLLVGSQFLLEAPGEVTRELHAKHAAELTTYVLVTVGVTATIIQGGLIGRLVKMFGEKKLLVVGTLCAALSLFLIPVIGRYLGFPGILLASVLLAMGSGLTTPSLSSLLSQSVDSNEQGSALGSGQSLAALGRVVGPSMSGKLFELMPGAPFWLGSVMMLFSTFVAVTLAGRAKARA